MSASKSSEIRKLSNIGRIAVEAGDWVTVRKCARRIQNLAPSDSEGHFLKGLAEKAKNNISNSIKAFSCALSLNTSRYDAAIELACLYADIQQYSDATNLLSSYKSYLSNSPLYLSIAANLLVRLGLYKEAFPLFKQASDLQPEIDSFKANLAECHVFLGHNDDAEAIYEELLSNNPNHQKNHYQLSRLKKATDYTHINQMRQTLSSNKLPSEKNIFLYYSIGKEMEDLGNWSDAFKYYKKAGDVISDSNNYDVNEDIKTIRTVINSCTKEWLAEDIPPQKSSKTPIFIAGLPRSGTTLTERIVSNHSLVESLDETFFIQMGIIKISGISNSKTMNADVLRSALNKDSSELSNIYFQLADYKFGSAPIFIDKLPENFIYLGFIAKSFPEAKIVLLNRNPMDVCFAMYKQSYFKFAYNLDDLGQYYVAFHQLRDHWRNVLGDRLIEVNYESLVSNLESQTRILLKKLDLPFEQACLDFDQNIAPSATASNIQVRNKVHTDSLQRWKHFSSELQPLYNYLKGEGIILE